MKSRLLKYIIYARMHRRSAATDIDVDIHYRFLFKYNSGFAVNKRGEYMTVAQKEKMRIRET